MITCVGTIRHLICCPIAQLIIRCLSVDPIAIDLVFISVAIGDQIWQWMVLSPSRSLPVVCLVPEILSCGSGRVRPKVFIQTHRFNWGTILLLVLSALIRFLVGKNIYFMLGYTVGIGEDS